jgi:hypothetical protein
MEFVVLGISVEETVKEPPKERQRTSFESFGTDST